MHLFNIMSERWDRRKSNLVSIRSIWLTQRQRKKTCTVKKKSPLFFNLIYYWLSSKNFYSLNKIIALFPLSPLPYFLSYSKVGVEGWGRAQCESVSLFSLPLIDVSRGQKKNRWVLLQKFFETKKKKQEQGGCLTETKLKLQTEIKNHGGTTFASEANRCVNELWPTDQCVRRALVAVSLKINK